MIVLDSVMTVVALVLLLAVGGCLDEPKGEGTEVIRGTGDAASDVMDGLEIVSPAECDGTVVEGGCPSRCQPIFSSAETYDAPLCIKEGFFFGCLPEDGDPFWDNMSVSTEYSACDRRPLDPWVYCFEGQYPLFWYYSNQHLFCRHPSNDCDGLPLPDGCEPG